MRAERFATPIRPALAIRIGITGTRALPDQTTALEAQLLAVLRRIREQLHAASENPAARDAYAADADGIVQPVLRLLSPLAEGADRLAARVALDLGYRLDVVMPFHQADYQADFDEPGRDPETNKASQAEFAALLGRASECPQFDRPRITELDGGRGDYEAASYGAAGRFVVRNCDLLIAIWNGRPGRGAGGTADTVRFAARCGPPVWLIDVEQRHEPDWVETTAQLRRPHVRNRGSAALAELDRYLVAVLIPPKPAPPSREGLLGRLFVRADAPLPRFLSEMLPLDGRIAGHLWKTEKYVMKAALLGGRWIEAAMMRLEQPLCLHPTDETLEAAAPARLEEPLPSTAVSVAGYWDRHYAVPDQLAVGYANRYRSAYALSTLLGALALFAAAAHGVWRDGAVPLALVECIALVLLLAIVSTNQGRRWHRRWISYRLLAELCRKQRALGMVGWSLPLGKAWQVARGEQGVEDGGLDTDAGQDAWVGWYFHAALRAAPLPAGLLAGATLNAIRSGVERLLLDNQLGYHTARAREARLQGRGLAGWGEVLLLLTAAAVALKALLMLAAGERAKSAVELLETLAQLLVIPSAAFVALRIYAELEMIAESNAAMAAMMRLAKVRLSTLRAAETAAEGAECPPWCQRR